MEPDVILLQSILENPSDIDARLVFGDYLAENNDPRGEFIQCEVATHRLPRWCNEYADMHFRARELELQHRRKWDRSIQAVLRQHKPKSNAREQFEYFYRIGFADHFKFRRLPSDLDALQELVEATPLRKITYHADDQLGKLSSPLLKSVSQLDLRVQQIKPRTHKALFGGDSPLELQQLRFYFDKTDRRVKRNVASTIANSPTTVGLTEFGCNLSAEDDALLSALLESPAFAGLESLELMDSSLGDAGLAMIAQSHLAGQLKSLNIKMSEVGDAGLVALSSAGLENLEELAVGWWFGTNPTGRGFEALFLSAGMARLEHLDLKGYRMEQQCAEDLANSTQLENLCSLNLSSTTVDDAKAQRFANSPNLRLRWLDLGCNRELTTRGFDELFQSEVTSELTYLNLEKSKAGDKVCELLAKSEVLSNLRYLNLDDTELSSAGIEQLCASERTAELRELSLGHLPSLDMKQAKALCDKKRFPNLLFVSMRGCKVSAEAKKKLKTRFKKGLAIEPIRLPHH